MFSHFSDRSTRYIKVLDGVKAGFGKVVFGLFLPLFFAFMFMDKLFSWITNYFKLRLSYGMTALKAAAAAIGGSRGAGTGNDKLDEIVESTGFIYDAAQDIFYSDMDAWQRNFGYCRLYDEAAAPLGMIVDCEPVYFRYDGKEWLIEIWKGQYDLTTGCEIGVYATEGPVLNIPGIFNGTFYYCVSNEEQLQLAYSLRKNNETFFVREDRHWWITGFKVGEFSKPSELSVTVDITLKDRPMRNAFIKGLEEAGYSDNEISVYGNTVSFEFDKPKTPQPLTRTRITDWMIQKKNKYMCDKYQDITGEGLTIQEKLTVLQDKAPKMLERIINAGKVKKLFRKHKKRSERYLDQVKF